MHGLETRRRKCNVHSIRRGEIKGKRRPESLQKKLPPNDFAGDSAVQTTHLSGGLALLAVLVAGVDEQGECEERRFTELHGLEGAAGLAHKVVNLVDEHTVLEVKGGFIPTSHRAIGDTLHVLFEIVLLLRQLHDGTVGSRKLEVRVFHAVACIRERHSAAVHGILCCVNKNRQHRHRCTQAKAVEALLLKGVRKPS